MTRAALILSIILLGQKAFSETWITLKDEPRRLHSLTSCARAADYVKKDTCSCCLVQHVDINNYNAAEAAEHCRVAHQCEFDEASFYDLEVARRQVANARKSIKAMTIVDVTKLLETPQLPRDAVLTNTDIVTILETLNKAGYLALPPDIFSTSKEAPLKLFAKPLGNSAKGVYSGQLFFIGYTKRTRNEDGKVVIKTVPLYILKETKKGVSEIAHLYKVDVSRLHSERDDTFTKHFTDAEVTTPTIARVAFDDLHFKLKTGNTRYFSLLQTAPGKSIYKHLRDFGMLAQTKDTDEKEFQAAMTRIKHIFYRMGFAMSQLHQKYIDPLHFRAKPLKKTYTHGDLHSENIFYDDVTDTVTLIDNETFALSLNHPSLGIDDIVEFYMMHTLKTIAHTVASQLTNNREFGINDALWHELWRSLFDGYLSAYGDLSREEFEELFNDFREQFYKGLSQFRIFKSPRNFVDQRKIKRFGPSIRRSNLKDHELAETFERLYARKIEGYVCAKSHHAQSSSSLSQQGIR